MKGLYLCIFFTDAAKQRYVDITEVEVYEAISNLLRYAPKRAKAKRYSDKPAQYVLHFSASDILWM